MYICSTSCDDLRPIKFLTFIVCFFSVILLVERNAQKQAELAKERDELNRTIQENKLLDEQEKARWGLELSHLVYFLCLVFSATHIAGSVQKKQVHI